MHPSFLGYLLFGSKVAGAVVTLGGIAWGIANWFGKVSQTNKNVSLLIDNHIPHIQVALTEHTETLKSLKSDVHSVSRRLDDHLNFDRDKKIRKKK
jgi:hypothetical protein